MVLELEEGGGQGLWDTLEAKPAAKCPNHTRHHVAQLATLRNTAAQDESSCANSKGQCSQGFRKPHQGVYSGFPATLSLTEVADPGTERLTLVDLFAFLLWSRCGPLQPRLLSTSGGGGAGVGVRGRGEDFDEEPKETSVTP